jgi:hypothetical protein
MAWWDYTLVKTKEIVGFQDDNDLNEKALHHTGEDPK